MVLASTSDCYGRNPDVPFDEESVSVIGSPHVRRWSYAVSKMFEEQALLAFRERYGLQGGDPAPVRRLRAAAEPHLVGRAAVGVHRGRAASGEEMELHGSGQQTRSFTYVDDMVEAFVRAVDVPAADGEMLNVGNDREITIEALARMVWRLVRGDEPARIKLVPLATFGRYEDVDRRVPDNRRAARVLGHTPQVALEDGPGPHDRLAAGGDGARRACCDPRRRPRLQRGGERPRHARPGAGPPRSARACRTAS